MAAVIIMIKKGGKMKIMRALIGVCNRQSLAVHQSSWGFLLSVVRWGNEGP